MDAWITQVGVGGILLILMIREVLNAKNNRNGNGNEGNGVSRSEFNKHKDTVQYKDNCEEIVKRLDAAFDSQGKMFEIMEKRIIAHFDDVKKLIKNGNK